MKRLLVACSIGFSLSRASWGQTVDIAKKVYESVNPSVFLIYLNDSSGKSIAFGTGFEIAPRMIATSAHVIQGGTPVISFGPVRVPAHVAKIDTDNDLAILTVDAELTSKPLILSKTPATPGEQVFAVGNPEGFEKTISQGIVSGVRTEGGKSYLQITSPISHGSSGGPVLNSRGEVVGIAAGMITEGQNLNFAVPVTYLSNLVASKSATMTGLPITPSALALEISDLMKESYSVEPTSAYQISLANLRSTIRSSVNSAIPPDSLHEIFCLAYSQAPDEIGDAVIEVGRKLLSIKSGPPAEVHAIIAYDLEVQAEAAESEAEKARLFAETRKEAELSLQLGKQGNGTADYVNGKMLELQKSPVESLRSLKRALGQDSKQFACGYNLTNRVYQESITAANDAGNYAEAEQLFQTFAGTGNANGFDWDSEGDRRAAHKEFLAAAAAYEKSEDFFPINACYSAYDYAIANGDHIDLVLSEGRKCFQTALKLNSEQSSRNSGLFAQTHAVMADALNSRGVWTEALSHAKDSISLDPQYAFGYFQQATALENLGRAQECIAAAQQAVILSDGKYSSYHFLLAGCYFDTENWASAATSYRKVTELDQNNASAAYNLALCLAKQGYASDAKDWMEVALKRNPSAELRAKINSYLK